jgi:hypothetical protein
MRYFKERLWMLPLIGGSIVLISLFTPVTTWAPVGNFAIQWMFQLGLRLEPFIELGLWRWNPLILSLSIILSVINFVSSILLILLTVNHKRKLKSYLKLKKYWLLFGILITLSTLAWIIKMEVFYYDQGGSHWQMYSPNVGIIAPFIGSGLIIVGFVLVKGEVERE